MIGRSGKWLCLTVATLTLASWTLTAPPSFAADAAAGKAKAKKCKNCHGLDGVAKIPIAPHIAGESEIYLQVQLKAFRSGKRTHEIMSVVAKDLTDEDIADLAAWYSRIKFKVELPAE